MNRLFTTLILALGVSLTFAQEGENDWKKEMPLDNGSHLLFTVTSFSQGDGKSLLGLDWGNTYNVYKLDEVDIAFGIRVSWIDAGFRSESEEFFGIETRNASLLATFIGIGPNATYKIQDKNWGRSFL